MTEQLSQIGNVIEFLAEIQTDNSVPRNVRTKIDMIVQALRQNSEIQIIVNKTLNDLDELSGDVNLQSYTRTQIWNVMSLLEKL